MPQPIDRCSSCHSPVYVEESVAGGCGCPERELRLLLARKRASNGGFSRTASAPLPALTPELLMSAEGQRELQAAQSIQPPRIRGRTADAVIIDDAAWGPSEADESHTAAAPPVSLEQMWLQGSGIPYDPEQFIGTASPPDDIEFGSDDIDLDTASPRPTGGRIASRTRVDRPQVEIGRAGRFPIIDAGRTLTARANQERAAITLAESIRAAEDERVFQALDRIGREGFDPRPTRDPGLTAQEANTRQYAKTLQEKQKLPTVYDRIQGDFLDEE